MPEVIKAKSLRLNNSIIQGFSTRQFGNMKFDHNRELVLANRDRLLKNIRIAGQGTLVRAQLVHNNNCHQVVAEDIKKDNRFWREAKIKNCDSLITDQPRMWLAMTFADCLPVFLWDDDNQAVGIVHAGWRGIILNVVGKTVQKMKESFGLKSDQLNAYIGPSIQNCCFEVQTDVWQSFQKAFGTKNKALIEKEKKKYINLQRLVKDQLIKKGIRAKKIEVSNDCTKCLSEKYFSYRAGDKKAQLGIIGIKAK